jgi:hypothetical protein
LAIRRGQVRGLAGVAHEAGVVGRRRVLPVHEAGLAGLCLAVRRLALLHQAARQKMDEEQRAVGGERGEDGGGEIEAEAGDEPGARRQRQERRRQDDEGVAEAHIEGLGRGKLTCHRVPTG